MSGRRPPVVVGREPPAGPASPAERRAGAFDASSAQAVMLDSHGVIVETNAAWRLFAHLGGAPEDTCGVGVDYLDVCRRSAVDDPADECATLVADGLQEILAGERTQLLVEYPCHSPIGDQWFLLHAYPAPVDRGGGVVVHHINITGRHLSGDGIPIDPRTAEAQVRDMLDALPQPPVHAQAVHLTGLTDVESNLGRAAAEEVFAAILGRVRRALRSDDVVVRVEPDLLMLVLAGAARPEQVCERLGAFFAEPVQVGAVTVVIAHSLGWATAGTGWIPADLFDAARRAAVPARTTTLVSEAQRPAVDAAPDAVPPAPATRTPWPPVGRWQHDADDLQTVAVLVVEDSPGDASLVTALLRDEVDLDVEPTVATTLAEALELLGDQWFDCVLLDLGLPDAQELEGLEQIRSLHPRVPVVVLTGRDDSELARRAVRVGAQDYLWKTDLGTRDLDHAIGFAVERSRAEMSERRLLVLLGRPSDLVVVVDEEDVITYASPSLASVVGTDPCDVVDQPLELLWLPEDLPPLEAALTRVRSGVGPEREVLGRLRCTDGSTRWGEATIEDWSGDPSIGGVVLSVRDVSERFAALAELRAEKATRDAIVSRSKDLVVFFARDGEILWLSPACRSLFGLETADLVGRNGFDLVHPDDRDRVAQLLARIPGTGDHASVEFRIVDAWGRVRWVEELVTNLIDDPLVGVVVGNLRDITERKAAEEHALFRNKLLAAVGQPVVATDMAGVVTYWNDAAEAVFGWTTAEAVGTPVSELIPPAEGCDELAGEVTPQPREGRTRSGEFWVRHRDGHALAVDVTTTPVIDDGRIIGTIAVSTDLTERMHAAQAKARLASIVDFSADAIYSLSADGVIDTWNAGAERLFGYSAQQIIGTHVSVLFPADLKDLANAKLARVLAGEAVTETDAHRMAADGSVVRVSVVGSPLYGPDGTATGVSVIARDISERMALIERIELERRRLSDAQRSAGLGNFEIDLETGRVYRSEELWRILGEEPRDDAPVGFANVHPDDRDRCRALFEQALTGDHDVEFSHRVMRPDGSIRWVVSRTSTYLDPSGRTLSGTVLDITDLKEAQAELEFLAYHDPLTALPNRSQVGLRLTTILAEARGTGSQTAVAMVDLDRFKAVNDLLGHRTGDAVLRAAAERFRACLVPGDVLGRFGGDAFVVVRPDCDENAAHELGRDLCGALDSPLELEDRSFELSASVGMVLVPPGGTEDDAYRDADAAMHEAKSGGRSRAVLLDDRLRQGVGRRLRIEDDLRFATSRNQMSVVYQPIVELDTGIAVGFEALLRWKHPELGWVNPDEFIAIAEEVGVIRSIGEWVLDQSLQQVARWRRELPEARDLWVAANLSGRQVAHGELVDHVAASLHGADLPPDALHLEVTESVLVSTVQQGIHTLESLRRLGVSIKVDDFGTGYSSLSYLKSLPVDSVKVDRSFVDGVGTDPHDTAIARAILSMASTLGLDVVAEGVETEQQLTALRTLGCRYGQGYLWTPGMDPERAHGWLVENLRSSG